MPRRRREDGAAAVEFALVVPLMFLLAFAIIQYGMYFWAMQGGAAAARDAARLAAVGNPTACTAFRTQVTDKLAGMTRGTPTITRTYTRAGATLTRGDEVTISVAFDSADLNLPFVPFIDRGRVTQTAMARVENVPDTSIGNCT